MSNSRPDEDNNELFAMADKVDEGGGGGGGETTSSAGVRNPAQSSMATEGPASNVCFSEEIDRPAILASSSRQPGTPNLTLDTKSLPRISHSVSRSPTALPALLSSSSPPMASRTRDRGYSLRRSLFARGISNRSENSPIELAEAEFSQQGVDKTGLLHVEETSLPRVRLSPTYETISPAYECPSDLQSIPGTDKDKKTLGVLSLPNYDIWARTRTRENTFRRTIDWIYKEVIIKTILRQQQIPPSKDGRQIELDASRTTPLIDERTNKEYIWNSIRSSRYTVWNFIPRQIFFQFSKLANAYFLLISILQLIPGLSTTGSYTTIAPLLVFVSISIAKEGYDDVRRYNLDKIENNTKVLVLNGFAHTHSDGKRYLAKTDGGRRKGLLPTNLRLPLAVASKTKDIVGSSEEVPSADGQGSWSDLKWKDVRVGDIIKLQRDDAVPADIVLLHSDGINDVAYIETMALDGETNLKTKQPPAPLAKQCGTLDGILSCRAKIVVEDPNIDLYNFEGKVTFGGETLPLTTNEIVLRGSTLRNTANAIGMVINTGEECKIRMNANKSPRIKAPAMQAIANKIVIMLVVFVILLALVCTIAYQIWTENVEENSWYLEGAHVKFSNIIIGFVILYNTLIPLSLYVSLEIIKLGQLLLLRDVDMYDPVSNTPMMSNTSTILENLGQVDYIFSDKTGTLTENIMRFRKLSVAGYAWLHDFDLQREAAEMMKHSREGVDKKKHKGKAIAKHFIGKRSTRPTLGLRNDSDLQDASPSASDSQRRASSVSLWRSSARPAKVQPELGTEDLLRFMKQRPHSVFAKKAKFFLLSLALCHTCVPEVQESGEIKFQAASPDELALVQAAQELGYMLIDRSGRTIMLKHSGGPDSADAITETYDILDVIEFSSKRKRMSIIVRFPNGKICIFCKGADSAILPRLRLASLALRKASEITRRSSIRKSLEAEQALRRLSEHSPRTSFSRLSFGRERAYTGRKSTGIERSNTGRKSVGQGRPSMASSSLQPIRDELDAWLTERKHDVGVTADDMSAYQSPRTSMGKLPRLSSEPRSSMQDNTLYDIVDDAVVLDDSSVFERCFQHVNDFATDGLRTLLFGYRFLDDQEYTGWKKIYMEATTSLTDRQQFIESAGEMIEQNFDLAGATAIEDKLQNGVPETIDKLRRANIKIWMLTGDKRETAINIAHSARLCKNYSEIVILDHVTGEVEQRMATAILDIGKGAIAHSVIVVDGQTLTEIDANETLSHLFFDLVVIADSVICCRASPSQKAALVKRIRTKTNRSITLAIGDGANDIAMIQEAHVGIGISGKEGLQAARISDYSIAQFRFLQKLLLVHGRWNYVRTGKYILGTFWKELTFFLMQALYQRWVGYTGTSLFESTSLTVFNTLFTSLAVIILGIFEQDLAASTLLAVPELYVYGQRNKGFNIKKYLAWMCMAVSESLIIYFLMFGLFGMAKFTNDDSVLAIGELCFTAAVVFINTKLLLLEMYNKTIISAIAWFLPVGGWFMWTILLSVAFKPSKTYPLYPIYHSFVKYWGRSLLWWLVLILTIAVVISLELGVSSVRKVFWPTDTDLFQELQKDPVIKARFEEMISSEVKVEVNDEGKTSTELREGEIQDLLDRRGVMHAGAFGEPDVNRSGRASLHRRRVSVDVHADGEASPRTSVATSPRTRHSADILGVLTGK